MSTRTAMPTAVKNFFVSLLSIASFRFLVFVDMFRKDWMVSELLSKNATPS